MLKIAFLLLVQPYTCCNITLRKLALKTKLQKSKNHIGDLEKYLQQLDNFLAQND